MRRKPWPIIILALVNYIMPFLNFLLSSIVFKVPFWLSLKAFLTYSSSFTLAMYFLPWIIVGTAILLVKRWSYPIVLLVYVSVLIFNTVHYSDASTSLSPFLILAIFIFNFSIITYFLLPEIRKTYLDPKLHWWEAKPRYSINSSREDNVFNIDLGNSSAIMSDISQGGLFCTSKDLSHQEYQGKIFKIKLNLLQHNIETNAKVVYIHPSIEDGFGLQFITNKKIEKKQIKALLKQVKKEGFKETRLPPVWTKDFYNWFMVLLKTGKGLV